MKYIKNLENLSGKRVLLRLDLNVPLKDGTITDETRIDKIIPIINFLIKKKLRFWLFPMLVGLKAKLIKTFLLSQFVKT